MLASEAEKPGQFVGGSFSTPVLLGGTMLAALGYMISIKPLAARTGLSVANASQYLQQLRRAGLVASRRDGKFVLYSLADDGVLDLLAALHQVAKLRITEVERILRGYFAGRDSMAPVSREELLARPRVGLVTVLDVHPPTGSPRGISPAP